DYFGKGNFRALGKRFGKQTPQVAQAIADSDAAALAAALAQAGQAAITVPGLGEVMVSGEDVILTERPRAGWSVVNEQGETVALDLEITPELELAGIAREVIRLVQEARKASAFDVSDRIVLTWSAANAKTKAAIAAHRELIASEVLALELDEDAAAAGFSDSELGLSFGVAKV
ncbi:MAG: DUF5915 domain-containing protein, partial [Propionibacteriaceae bacterium]|nr:DUF5915 domain-containing protein [Propionibacteriaceae bacterium]